MEKLSEIVIKPRNIAVKIMITSVTSKMHEIIIPDLDHPPRGHFMLRIPRNLENSHTIRPPTHFSRRVPRRLVRIPDENVEFGMKLSDIFDLSDANKGSKSDISIDDTISETEIMDFGDRKKLVSTLSNLATLNSNPFKTVREAQSKFVVDEDANSSDISISDDDAAVEAGRPKSELISNDDIELLSTDSES